MGNGPLTKDTAFPNFRDFEVTHHYLQTASRNMQSRLRKRGRMGKYSYIHTIRKQMGGQVIEVKTPLTHRDYLLLLDIYKDPCHPRCKGLVLLETYTTLKQEEFKD